MSARFCFRICSCLFVFCYYCSIVIFLCAMFILISYTAVSTKVVQLKSVKAHATIPKGFQRDGRRCYEYLFACVKRNKMNSELLTCLLSISQTTFRHCRVRFYDFFGQSLSKKLYSLVCLRISQFFLFYFGLSMALFPLFVCLLVCFLSGNFY